MLPIKKKKIDRSCHLIIVELKWDESAVLLILFFDILFFIGSQNLV